jgi:hypothetical protein
MVEKVKKAILAESEIYLHGVEEYTKQLDKNKIIAYINVLFSPTATYDYKISKQFIKFAIKNLRRIVYHLESEYNTTIHDIGLEFDLYYQNFKMSLRSGEVDECEVDKLGSEMPEGIDVIIGGSMITEMEKILRYKLLGAQMNNLHPVFRGRHFEFDDTLCFVLMPFNESWSERIWNRHIKPTIEKIGMKCIRADDILGSNIIVEDIWEKINSANIIIADITKKNPNVFYELGLAHVVGTPTIIISQDNEKATFDVAHYRYIIYQDNSEGCEVLEKMLTKTIISIRNKMKLL